MKYIFIAGHIEKVHVAMYQYYKSRMFETTDVH